MADTTTDDEMFRPQALGRLQTTDDLDAYIRVTSPSGWVVLAAAVAFLLGILIWSNTASIPTTHTFSGLQDDINVTAWVDSKTFESIKDSHTTAVVGGIRANVATYNETPFSKSEILEFLGSDYMTRAATVFDWNYLIYLELEEKPETTDISDESPYMDQDDWDEVRLVPVEITTAETHPIRLVFESE